MTFTLRPGLTFSDGTPLSADDVVRSWRRLFIPGEPSPLASLIADVKGARDLLTGASSDTSTLGVRAEGDRTVIVELERGGGDLPGHRVRGAVRGGAVRAWVMARSSRNPGRWWAAGAYTLERVDPDRFVLKANPRYWAGEPAIGTVRHGDDARGRQRGGGIRDG